MYLLPETIITKFNDLIDAVHQETDNLKMSAAETVLDGDFSQVTLIEESYRKLQELESDIKLASTNFESKYKPRQNTKSAKQKHAAYRTRKPSGHLRVRINNQVIEEQTIADTFVEVLKLFGYERVAQLHKVVSAAPLISKTPINDYQTQKRDKDWYITTHVNMKNAKKILEEISKELKIPIQIKIIER